MGPVPKCQGILHFAYPPTILGMGELVVTRPLPEEDRPGLVCVALPYGLMSLRDLMHNFYLPGLCSLCTQLMFMTLRREEIMNEGTQGPFVTDKDKADMRGWLKIAGQCADLLESKAIHDRIKAFGKKLERNIPHQTFHHEIVVLRETIDSAMEAQIIYRYPAEKNTMFIRWTEDWEPVLKAFPSIQKDIVVGVDLWALGHSTPSVFQFMRVLEHGLRALAKDVEIDFSVQNWQNVIDQIEAEIRRLGKTLPAGLKKSERLQFLSEAAKEFVYFKDGWRNYVSHNRAEYDDHQARSVMEHVRSFMTTLSKRLSEEPSAEQSS